jgi:hypothetical protein
LCSDPATGRYDGGPVSGTECMRAIFQPP